MKRSTYSKKKKIPKLGKWKEAGITIETLLPVIFVCLFSATNTVLVLEDKNQVYGTEKTFNTELVNL